MDHILQLNEFFVEGGDQASSHVLLHITEPSTDEERKKGYFFAIAEINHATTQHIAALQDRIDQIENEYYETPDEINKTSLETVLEKNNAREHLLLTPEIDVSGIVGVIRQPDIIFSYCGKPDILLFYKNRQDVYRTLNLLDTSPGADTPPKRQLFGDIVQGKISAHDYLLVTTPHIENYFDTDRLQKLITSRPAQASAEHLERVLKSARDGFSFGGIIIHIAEVASETTTHKARPTTRGQSIKSLTGLFKTEQKTAYTLAPNVFQQIGAKTKNFLQASRQSAIPHTSLPTERTPLPAAEINATHRYAHQPPRSPHSNATPILKNLLSHLFPALKQIIHFFSRLLAGAALVVWSIVYALIHNLVLLIFVIGNIHNRRRPIIDDWRRGWRNYKEGFVRLPLVTKIIVIGSIACAVLFLVSILYIRHEEQKRLAENVFQTNIQTIKNKTDSAESALIYNNQTDALGNLLGARALLATLACSATTEHKTACAALSEQLNSLLAKTRKVVNATPIVLATWPTIRLDGLIKINSKLIAWSATSSNVLSYDLLTKQTQTLTTYPALPGFTSAAAPKENDFVILIANQKDFVRLNPKDNSVSIADIGFPSDRVGITAAVIYNRRLYSLDTLNNQIYKHDIIKTGFGRGREWLKNTSANLKDGISLAIDGDLFALKNNGQIIKFSSGVQAPFSIQGLDPGLGGGGKIWTYNDTSNLYILDGSNQRLVIVGKDGRLVKQITASVFKNPSGLVVDEINNVMYVADSGTLFQVNLK